MKTPARRWSALFCLTLICGSLGCTKAPIDEQAQRLKEQQPELLKKVEPTLTYPVVIEDIEKHIGRTIAWDGITLGSYRGPKDGTMQVRENYTYLPVTDQSGGVDFDKPFMFHRLEGGEFRTEAAKRADADPKHHRRRLVIGAIVGSEDFKFEENGVARTIAAPVLKDVIVDVPVGK